MAKTVALIFGIIYTLVGIVGFLSPLGGTTGMTPTNLLGLFPINLAHNVVHLVIGVPGLFVAGSESNAASYLKIFGVILVLVGVVGIFLANPLGIFPIGGKDVYLHLATGIIFLWASRSTSPVKAAA